MACDVGLTLRDWRACRVRACEGRRPPRETAAAEAAEAAEAADAADAADAAEADAL